MSYSISRSTLILSYSISSQTSTAWQALPRDWQMGFKSVEVYLGNQAICIMCHTTSSLLFFYIVQILSPVLEISSSSGRERAKKKKKVPHYIR